MNRILGKIYNLTLRVDGDFKCFVGSDILVVVEQERAGIKLVAAGQHGVRNLRGVIEGRGQSSDLTSDHEDLLGEKSLEEGSGLVSHTQDLDIVQRFSRSDLLLKLSSKICILVISIDSICNSPDGFVDVAVDSSSKASVGSYCH